MLTPTQCTHIMNNWHPVCCEEEYPTHSVGNQEKWVSWATLKSAGVMDKDLQSEEGGIFAGTERVNGEGRVPVFDVQQTQKRAAMTREEWERHKRETQQGMEVGG